MTVGGSREALNATRQRGREARMRAGAAARARAANSPVSGNGGSPSSNGERSATPPAEKTVEEKQLEAAYANAVEQDKGWERWNQRLTCGFSYQCCEVFSMVLGAAVILWAVVGVYLMRGFPFQKPFSTEPLAVPAYVESVQWTLTAQRQLLQSVHYENVRTPPPSDAVRIERTQHTLPAADAETDTADDSGPRTYDTYNYDRYEWVTVEPRLTTPRGGTRRQQSGKSAPTLEEWSGTGDRLTARDLQAPLQHGERLNNVLFRATAKLLVSTKPPTANSDSAATAAATASTTTPVRDPANERVEELTVGLYGFDALVPDKVGGWVTLRDGMLDIGDDARTAMEQRLTNAADRDEREMPPVINASPEPVQS